MKDYKIDSAIESVNSEKKEAMRARLRRDLDLSPSQERQEKKKRFLNAKTFAFGLAGICAVCLAIVLPVSLRTAPQEGQKEGYCATSQLTYSYLGCTLKEYGERTGKNILYLDWYDVSDYTTIKYYWGENEEEIYYLYEDYYYHEAGCRVGIAVADTHTHIIRYDWFETAQTQFVYDDVSVKWFHYAISTGAVFVYEGYKYYIEIYDLATEAEVLEIVKNIFKKNKIVLDETPLF